ncbi:unnamed protein product [Pocillopora meandrina]|uniref:Uncharacterized protein n=1 Tax=Pocillopora meandrina TaxID=46732 RepID=A0AAU9X8D2_9CNID|nr:unnamed protein product [Pocillopora meandrina]
MMKTFFLVAFFLFGFASAKPKPAKRALSCKAFPAKLSGRLYMVIVSGSGGTSKLEITFSMDSEREIAHLTSQYAGTEINIIQDYKGGKTYTIYPQGCYSSPLEGELFPLNQLKGLTLEASGKLGLNGVKVNVYGGMVDQAHWIFTFEDNDSEVCIPVSFGSTKSGSATSGSFLDLSESVDPEKLQIPEDCNASPQRRSLPDLLHPKNIHTASVQAAMKRGFAWLGTQRDQKRGFPWTHFQRRGFPWTN